jgi:integrase
VGGAAARLVDPPRLERRHPSAFIVEEFQQIEAVCGEDRLGALFLFAAFTGIRRSEALGLVWRDADLDGATFQVREGLHQIRKASERVTGRTGLIRVSAEH